MINPVIEQAVLVSLANYEKNHSDNSLSDLYLYFDEESNSLCIYDDMENLLNEQALEEAPYNLVKDLKSVFKKLEADKAFDKPFIYKPFTASLVDESLLVTEELIFVDDETMKLDNDLWNNLEKELDDFMKDLMD